MTMVPSASPAIEQSQSNSDIAYPTLPSWVDGALRAVDEGPGQTNERIFGGVRVRIRDAGTMALCSVTIDEAARFPASQLRHAVAGAYSALFAAGDELGACNRVRMWSFIPGIHAPRGDGLNTYHVFNQGRFDAFAAKLGDPSEFAARLPTATGVGHEGSHLAIHALMSHAPGIHVENPRQVPAYRYSARYGPRPPCFARATIVTSCDPPMLLVGGTASVRDEVSMHADDLMAQLAETFENLRAVVSAASAICRGGKSRAPGPGLNSFAHLRVYCPRRGSERTLQLEIKRHAHPNTEIELVNASLCREELLIEIEGVASLGGVGREIP